MRSLLANRRGHRRRGNAAPLPAGAWAHFHDVMFPYDYSRQILSSELSFGHESALLMAFSTYNSRFAIATSLSMRHYECSDELRQLLPNYVPAGSDQGLETTRGHSPHRRI